MMEQLHSGATVDNTKLEPNSISIKQRTEVGNYDYSNLPKVTDPKDYFWKEKNWENSLETVIAKNKSVAPSYIEQNFLVKKVEWKEVYILSQMDRINLKYVDLFYVDSEIQINQIKNYIETLLSVRISLNGLINDKSTNNDQLKKQINTQLDAQLDDSFYDYEENSLETIQNESPKQQIPNISFPNNEQKKVINTAQSTLFWNTWHWNTPKTWESSRLP